MGYEIPQGNKIYFGASARLKRDVERMAVEIFCAHDFNEITTPLFRFANPKDSSKAIRFNAERNSQMTLRHDNTLDVIEIIKYHLDDAMNKKWFYIQPTFLYPTTEISQIGAECLDEESKGKMICIAAEIFSALQMSPVLQISNINIPRLCAKESGLDIGIFANMQIDKMLRQDSYFADLLSIQSKSDVERYIPNAPQFLRHELEHLLESAGYCDYENTIFAPLHYPFMEYYDSLFFRMFIDNRIFLRGGKYEIDGIHSCGFAIYTNEVIEYILNKVN